jgi:Protein of unknown function (DUF732)
MFFRASSVAAALSAAGSVIAGIGLAPPAPADVADDSFLQALDGYGIQYGSVDKAILVAKAYVCDQLDANPGETLNDLVSGVASNTNWSGADSAFFTGSAITSYCPHYKYLVDAPPPVDGPTNVPIS